MFFLPLSRLIGRSYDVFFLFSPQCFFFLLVLQLLSAFFVCVCVFVRGVEAVIIDSSAVPFVYRIEIQLDCRHSVSRSLWSVLVYRLSWARIMSTRLKPVEPLQKDTIQPVLVDIIMHPIHTAE